MMPPNFPFQTMLLSHSLYPLLTTPRLKKYLGAGIELAAGQSDSNDSVVRGTGISDKGMRSWFQSRWGKVSTMQGKAKSVSRE